MANDDRPSSDHSRESHGSVRDRTAHHARTAAHLTRHQTRRAAHFALHHAGRGLRGAGVALGRGTDALRPAWRITLSGAHHLEAWFNRLGHRRERWLLGSAVALILSAPIHYTLAVEPTLAAYPVNILHGLGLTSWQAKPYDDIRQIPYHVVEVKTDDLPTGTKEADKNGHAGLKRVTGLVFQAPRKKDERQVSDRVIRDAQDGHVRIGTGKFVVVNGHHYDFTKVLHLTATAYDFGWVSNGRWTGRPSRLGVPLGPGIAAVDPGVIPLGTWLYVSGYGLALAADTGNAIKGNRIDLFYDLSHQEVLEFGFQPVTVYELDLPKVPPVKHP